MLRQQLLSSAAALLIPTVIGCASNGVAKSPPPAPPPPPPGGELAMPIAAPSGVARRSDPLYAYVDDVRSELSDGKATLINRVMRLNKADSGVFWPIYNEYEQELFALGDQRVDLYRRWVRSQLAQSLDDAGATSMADEWFQFESQRLELLRKYHQRIAKELSPLRAAQFAQVEHRVATVVDLLVASETPLVTSAARH